MVGGRQDLAREEKLLKDLHPPRRRAVGPKKMPVKPVRTCQTVQTLTPCTE